MTPARRPSRVGTIIVAAMLLAVLTDYIRFGRTK